VPKEKKGLGLHKSELTPKEIVAELDKYVVGQHDAKRAVAIALRNRWRRKQVDPEIRDEIYPHNILMVGPTGVGKTEIARRLARMLKAPFVKVEATKFTEVGYVGRDVDSIVRDLIDIAVNITKEKLHLKVATEAQKAAEDRIIEALVGEKSSNETKEKFRVKLKKGELEDTEIEIAIADNPPSNASPLFDIPGMPGGQMGVLNIGDIISKALGGTKTKNARMKVKEAYNTALREESDKLVDEEKMIKDAINLVENDGIVFLDEIDKICSRGSEGSSSKGEVSREGVQRDLLPLLEGSTVTTKYGPVKTDHILFIASGAFHLAKPADLLPELQGRLPIRVELKSLDEEDLARILKEPKHSLLKQYAALFNVEKVGLNFVESGIKSIARIAAEINKEIENIGARRLHTILEKLLEGINFSASDTPNITIDIDEKYVENNLSNLRRNTDLSKFIL
jgi:ATP-dependent HslUV protease ATP-binding subunit HslU